jgi:alpha-L-fucosidase
LYFTKKGKNLYAIAQKWEETITIQNVAKPIKINLLGFKGDVKFTYKNNVLTIIAPQVEYRAL